MTTPRSNQRSRFLAPALGAALALLAAASFSGCLVSFDGYELADAGGATSGASGSGGTVSGGRAGSESSMGGTSGGGNAGTSASAGTSSGGTVGLGGTAGTSGGGGVSTGGGGTSAGGTSAGGTSAGGKGGSVSTGGGGAGGINGGGAGGKAGSGGSSGSAGSGGSAGNPASCPAPLHGAILVEIPKPGGGIYCIDRTEVTNQDYAQFLASSPDLAAQTPVCTANATFAPAADAINCTQYDPAGKPKAPVSCVNWCDAQAFCAWAGKRMCGKIGGGTNTPADFANAAKSEWYAACSHAGSLKFPYGATNGDIYAGAACVGADYGLQRPGAVPTASCQGGYDGVFDLSGNVSEWEDSCAGNTGQTDLCLYRGGSYLDLDTGTTPTLLCNSGTAATPKAVSKARSTRDKEIGFRCCADP